MYYPPYILLGSSSYFVEDFYIYVYEVYYPVVSFFGDIFVWLWYQGNKIFNYEFNFINKYRARASLVVQWLRICLPMQGTWVRGLVREDPTCHGATKPVCHNY